jgi:hypothetical protein
MDAVSEFEAATAISDSSTAVASSSAALIEVLDTHGRIHTRHRLMTPGSVCTIGRSVGCDIVLDDPYAAAEHVSLTLLDNGRVAIRDLGTRNGTRVDGALVESVALVTECELIVGRTRVRIRTALTALTPERVFRRDVLQRHRTILALIGLALCLAYIVFSQWVAYYDPLAPRIVTAVLVSLFVIGAWTAIWGLITRFTHGHWSFRTHAAIATNTLAFCLWCDWLLGLALFSFQWRWLELLDITLVAAAGLSALYLHLRKATHFSIRTAALVAAATPMLLAGAALWVTQQNSAQDINRISLGPAVYPPQYRVAQSAELNDYLADVERLKREANRKRRMSLADRPLAETE